MARKTSTSGINTNCTNQRRATGRVVCGSSVMRGMPESTTSVLKMPKQTTLISAYTSVATCTSNSTSKDVTASTRPPVSTDVKMPAVPIRSNRVRPTSHVATDPRIHGASTMQACVATASETR